MRVFFGHVTRSFHHKKGSNHFLLLSSPLLFIQNFFFTWICHKKASHLIEVEMSTTSIVAAATKEGLLSLWRLIKTPLSKRTNFS